MGRRPEPGGSGVFQAALRPGPVHPAEQDDHPRRAGPGVPGPVRRRPCGSGTKTMAARTVPLAVDGKTMRGAVDADGVQTHVMGVVGHDSRKSYAKKKSE